MVKGGVAIQLVRDYVEEGLPFEAEVWYYGETEVKGLKLVMHLGVIEEKGFLDFFVASSSMAHITGVMAEFRKGLPRALKDSHVGKLEMTVLEGDEEIRKAVEDRSLFIDREIEE